MSNISTEKQTHERIHVFPDIFSCNLIYLMDTESVEIFSSCQACRMSPRNIPILPLPSCILLRCSCGCFRQRRVYSNAANISTSMPGSLPELPKSIRTVSWRFSAVTKLLLNAANISTQASYFFQIISDHLTEFAWTFSALSKVKINISNISTQLPCSALFCPVLPCSAPFRPADFLWRFSAKIRIPHSAAKWPHQHPNPVQTQTVLIWIFRGGFRHDGGGGWNGCDGFNGVGGFDEGDG